jgi:hypothetical protein
VEQLADVRLTRTEGFPAWSGSRANLESLQRLTEESLEQAYERVIADLQLDDADAMARASTAATRLRLNVSVTSGVGGRLRRTGAIAAILAEMDLADVDRVVFRNERGDDTDLPEVYVELNKRPSVRNAVTLRVTGNDKRWVAGTTDMLFAELRKRQPSWAVMRRGTTAVLFAVLLIIAGMAVPVAKFASRGPSASSTVAGLVVFSVLLGIPILGLLLHSLLLRWFPALDLTEVGGTSQVRRVGAIVGWVASFALAIAGLIVGVLAL